MNKIKGYRELSQEEIDLMNRVKQKAEEVGALCSELEALDTVDMRWQAIGKTDLQKGFMALIRSIAKPRSF